MKEQGPQSACPYQGRLFGWGERVETTSRKRSRHNGLSAGPAETPSLLTPANAASTGASEEASDSFDFEDRFEFYDDVHGSIAVSKLERDAIDSPEFQRLFRLGQLGFVDLVFPTANHTRGVHCIGACHVAKDLAAHLNANNAKSRLSRKPPCISPAERALIGLGALLHDIPHGPFSHDIEKKSHQIYLDQDAKTSIKVRSHYGIADKHDDFEANPALYVALLDHDRSILAQVLRYYSPGFVRLLERDAATEEYSHLQRFVELSKTLWPNREDEMLPSLVFHLLVYEKEKEAKKPTRTFRVRFDTDEKREWGLGPQEAHKELHGAWYQPYRHDIIGDTLSADLIDYILRDQSRLGMKNVLDMKLLNYYVLVPLQETPGTFRCALDLNDHKRGTFRAERLNDIFRLLDIRHQIHEKAVSHRVVQAAVAMLSRIGLLLADKRPTLEQMYGYGQSTNSLSGDAEFMRLLVEGSNARGQGTHQSLAVKLAERRVYRPLVVMSGDRVPILLKNMGSPGDTAHNDFRNEQMLRELAAVVDSTLFSRFFLLISLAIEGFLQHGFASKQELNERLQQLAENSGDLRAATQQISKRVIFWTTPYKQLYKDPAILVCANDGVIDTIDRLRFSDKISEDLRKRLQAGIEDAETKNEGLWKLYVFLSDGLFYTGTLAKLQSDHACANRENHATHLRDAQNIAIRALQTAWEHWVRNVKPSDAHALSKEMDDDTLSRLLKRFLSNEDFEKGERHASEISSVDVDLYLHDTDRECRDVRYKFARKEDAMAVIARMAGGDRKRKGHLEEIFKWLHLEKDYLSAEELEDVLVRIERDGQILTEGETKAARNDGEEESLRLLWQPFRQKP